MGMGMGMPGTASAGIQPRSFETHDIFVMHLAEGIAPTYVARELGVEYSGPVGELSDHHVFSIAKERKLDANTLLMIAKAHTLWGTKLGVGTKLHRRTVPSLAQPPGGAREALRLGQVNHDAVRAQARVASQLGISDPRFKSQWHLMNTVQPGNDLNVSGVWLEGVFGEGVTTAVVDDGLDFHNLDLSPNYYAGGSYDFNDDVPEPLPRLRDDHHGTLCAAEIAAARNEICGVGVAYRSRVSGIRMLSGTVDDVDQAAAMNFDYQNNDIYSCSWGPEDDGRQMKAPGVLVQRAIVNGVQRGRGGKGSIYVFSAGNGAGQDDNCNFDGYTNSIYSITVGAIDRTGRHAPYSESCSAQLVVAWSSGSGDGIYTTDNGDQCTALHSGTSAAAPLAAGVIALALSVRPDLTWRDVQHLLVQAAVPVHPSDGSWQTKKTGAGHAMYSHDWGYGRIDAYALVQAARGWELVKPQAWLHAPWQQVHEHIPEGHQGLSGSYTVTREALGGANMARLEHVTVTINVQHARRGDVSVELVSPSGIVSYLSTPRLPDDAKTGYVDWEFMSVAHWGEAGEGTWRIIVKDTNVNGRNGTFESWRLNLWGEAIDGAKQPLHALPGPSNNTQHGLIAATMKTAAAPIPDKTPSSEAGMTTASSAVPSSPPPHRHDWQPGSSAVYVVVCGLAAAVGIVVLLLCNLPIMTERPAKSTTSRSKKARRGRRGALGHDMPAEDDDTYPLVP
ncbi:hypothetical protein EsHS_00006570 [Epichloe bromicola]